MARPQQKRLGYGNSRFAHTFTVDGVTDTLNGWAKRLGCTYLTIYKRIMRGMTPEEAIRAGGRHLWRKQITINGGTHTLAGWGRKTGIDPDLISERMIRGGWSAEEAVGLAPHANRAEKRITYRGKTRNIAQWARELGIEEGSMRARLRLNNDGRLARRMVFTKGLIEPGRIIRKVKYQNWYRGKRISIDEMARRKGCGRNLIHKWFRAGFTATQILDNQAIAPCRDNAEIARRSAESFRRNRHLRELRQLGIMV